jgi:hypothetical protein
VSFERLISPPAGITRTLPWNALATASLRALAKGATLSWAGSLDLSGAQLLPMYLTNLLPVGLSERADPRAVSFLVASLLIKSILPVF